MQTTLVNTSRSEFVSELLRSVEEAVRARGEEVVSNSSEQSLGQKGSIIIDLVIGVSSSAAWELLKAAVTRLKRRPGYKKELRIEVDGREITIRSIEES